MNVVVERKFNCVLIALLVRQVLRVTKGICGVDVLVYIENYPASFF